MTKERNAFIAGLFIIVCIGLIFTITVMIKGVNKLTEPTVIRIAQFGLKENIGGLRVGDDARVGGLKLGVVKSINLVRQSDGNQKIFVSFDIPAKIELRQNARVTVERGLTGTSNLNIDSLGDGPVLGPSDMLTGSPDSLTSLLASASELMPVVKGTVSDVKTQTLPRANTMLDKFGGTADTGKEALAQIRDLFGDTKTDFREVMKNLNSTTATIDKKLPPILDDIHVVLDKAKGTVDSINVALEDVKKTVANTRDITASGKSLIAGNKSKLDGMIASLKAAGDNLKAATAEIRHSPWRLLYKPGAGEVANLNLYDSARHFADGAAELNDAAGALRDALKDPNADQAKVQTLVEKLDKSFENFNEVEASLWKNVKQ
jgi:ABC-type transporter Mla subunit MlaD